jgi:cytochrome c-type biogenesis protein CcmH/NrfG
MTEWIQIAIAVAVFVPLTILTGRYLYWRQWDQERRTGRLVKRRAAEYDAHNPGFSVKVP